RVLADAVIDVPPSGVLDIEVGLALDGHLGRAAEIGCATEEPGNLLRQRVDHLSRRLTGGDPLGVGGEHRQLAVPAGWGLGPLPEIQLAGEVRLLLPVTPSERLPL